MANKKDFDEQVEVEEDVNPVQTLEEELASFDADELPAEVQEKVKKPLSKRKKRALMTAGIVAGVVVVAGVVYVVCRMNKA